MYIKITTTLLSGLRSQTYRRALGLGFQHGKHLLNQSFWAICVQNKYSSIYDHEEVVAQSNGNIGNYYFCI